MTKVLKQLNYVERLKMFISRMQTSNWVEGGDTPIALVKMVNGDSIKGLQINCDNEDAIKQFLINFGPASAGDFGEPIVRVVWGESSRTFISILGESMGMPTNIVGVSGEDNNQYFYCPQDIPFMGMTMPQGWSYLDSGEGKFIKITGILELPIENVGIIEVSDKVTDDVNGVVFGEVKGEPGPTPPGPTPPVPTGLTPFESNDSIAQIKFNTSLGVSDVIALLGGSAEENPDFNLPLFDALASGEAVENFGNVSSMDIGAEYPATVITISNTPVWTSQAIVPYGVNEPGWIYSITQEEQTMTILDENGVFANPYSDAVITNIHNNDNWNGSIAGKVE